MNAKKKDPDMLTIDQFANRLIMDAEAYRDHIAAEMKKEPKHWKGGGRTRFKAHISDWLEWFTFYKHDQESS